MYLSYKCNICDHIHRAEIPTTVHCEVTASIVDGVIVRQRIPPRMDFSVEVVRKCPECGHTAHLGVG